MNKSKKGFTLIELIVVLAILAVIAAIAVPTAFGSIEKARVAADKASVDSFNSTINYQSALIMTDPSGNVEGTTIPHNSVEGAFTAGGMKKDKYKAQSKEILVKWNPATGSAPGYFEVDAAGTKIVKGDDFFAKLVDISKGGATLPNGDEIVDTTTPAP